MHFQVFGNRTGGFAGAARPLIAGRFGQRRLTSPLRLASPLRKLPTLSCTRALVSRYRFPVVSSLAQPQAGRRQKVPHRLAAVRRSVVSDHGQWFGVSRPQLQQEGGRGYGIAVTLQFHPLHLPGL